MRLEAIQRETQQRWEAGNFLEHVEIPPYEELNLLWVPYEDYMQAQQIRVVPGEIGELHIRFQAGTAEDKYMHVHPDSDRVITVLLGSGTFVAVRNGEEIRLAIQAGDRLWMPRGTVHNFFAGEELIVHSVHSPFVPFEDPLCFVRQK